MYYMLDLLSREELVTLLRMFANELGSRAGTLGEAIDDATAACGDVDLVGCHPNMVAEQVRASLPDDRLNNMVALVHRYSLLQLLQPVHNDNHAGRTGGRGLIVGRILDDQESLTIWRNVEAAPQIGIDQSIVEHLHR